MGKVYCYIALLFLSGNALAQSTGTARRDTSGRLKRHQKTDTIKKSDTVFTKPPDSLLYVIDGFIADKKMAGVDSRDILMMDTLGNPGATNIYGEQGKHGVVLIMTLNIGIEDYQRKLSSLSWAYRIYIESNKNDDSGLVYLLNGVVLDGDRSDKIKKLYNEIEKIKSVDFIDKFSEKLNLNNPKPIVVITTKK